MTDEVEHGQLILNVDDTEASRYLKTRMLAGAGYQVLEAANGAEGLRLARANKPALVLLDIKMPDINGYEVCRALKQDPETQMILVLQTSASYIGTQNKIRALDNGADNFLSEPFDAEELIANVKALLRLGRVESELREVARRKDEFLAVLAHELRNPLAPIKSAVELLRQLRPDVSDAEDEARSIIMRQTQHLVRLVDDLLDVARISRGQIRLREEDVPIGATVRTAVETSITMIKHRQHALTVDLPDEELWVRGDQVRIAQTIANLLHNAAKFTPIGGQLHVGVESHDNEVLIAVKDNGIGISPEQSNHIFSLFAQAGHSDDRVQDGLGIGLFLVKTLMELHGGRISVASAGSGQGSVFEVMIPRIVPTGGSGHASAAGQPVTDAPAVNARRRRILVVDDNLDAAHLISSLLEIDGHIVQQRYDGASAIELAHTFKPDAVVLDVGLPDMSGLDVARSLRQLPGMEKCLIVALTGYGQERDKEAVMAAGFDVHLTKPVMYEQLSSVMDRLA